MPRLSPPAQQEAPAATIESPPTLPRKARRKAARAAARNVAPVTRNRTPEPMEQQIGQDHERVMKSTGPAKDSLEPALVQAVDRPVDPEKLEMLAFMEELVTVHIHTTSDPQAEQVFEIFNNGLREIFKRGEQKDVKRKFVNELATRKITTYTQDERLDASGTRVYVQIPHTALKYPFSIVRDVHPRGADWLRFTLAAK